MKPFLTKGNKTSEETFSYIECMLLTEDVGPDTLTHMDQANIEAINAYIESPATATTFNMIQETKSSGEIITSELVYYWMTMFKINWEAQYWHLNRLFALIRICNVKQSKPKKMSPQAIREHNARINAERRKRYGTSG